MVAEAVTDRVCPQAGILLARRLFGGSRQQMDYDLVPTTVFTPLVSLQSPIIPLVRGLGHMASWTGAAWVRTDAVCAQRWSELLS